MKRFGGNEENSTSGLSFIAGSSSGGLWSKVFINLLASKEGQEVWARAAFHQSLRLDVSTAHLPPDRIRTEGVKYVDVSTEELTFEHEKVLAPLARELFGALVR